jgi:acetyl-CoA C-acetyltransferase
MVSLVMADLGAAVILTTERSAARTRGGGAKPVYFLGGGFAKDRQRFMVDKSDYTRSPALAQAAARAEARAGIRVADVECFDLYSCFPSAVSVARRELALSDDDPRTLTLTGGLCFFGGPGSNYALHGIATLAETIAAGHRRNGMTTALGWFMHKYAAGIYGAEPNRSAASAGDLEDEALPEAGAPPVPVAQRIAGRGRIETYTVTYNRDRAPTRALVYGRTDGGLRFVANTPGDPSTYAELTGENQVGRTVRLRTADGLGYADLE